MLYFIDKEIKNMEAKSVYSLFYYKILLRNYIEGFTVLNAGKSERNKT